MCLDVSKAHLNLFQVISRYNEALKATLINWPAGQLMFEKNPVLYTLWAVVVYERMRIFRSMNSLLQAAESSLKLLCTSSSEDRQNQWDPAATDMSLKHRCPSRCCIFILCVFMMFSSLFVPS